jgi:feruloyl esterase
MGIPGRWSLRASGAAAVAALALAADPSSAQLPATAAACAGLSGFRAAGVQIEVAAVQPAGPLPPGPRAPTALLPAHCLVQGRIDPRVGVGGKSYAIRFEMRLPFAWNGRFLFQGGGGLNGVVAPAIGAVKGPPALTLGYAVVTQDAGHAGGDAAFGQDQQARLDHEYRSYERVTLVAKDLVGAFYARPPQHSYFMGCSEGGREALLMSQRMPLEYDGVVAGDPGFQLGVTLDEALNRVTMARIAPKGPDGKPDLARAFSTDDLKLLADRITDACDAKDGLKDGLIDNWTACRIDLRTLRCQGAKIAGCLTPAQVAALEVVFNGARNGKAEIVSLGYPMDTGVGQPNWRQWKMGAGPGGPGGVSSMQGLFRTPYDPAFDEDHFDADRDLPRMAETGSRMRADGVEYSSFRQHGGKILIYTGVSDPIFSPKALVAYYRRLGEANGGAQETLGFARLFLAPGMTHCAGGLSLDTFDPLAALVDWVENGHAPERLVASGAAFPGRTRPLCPYPEQSRYVGEGSIEDARNFACRTPAAYTRPLIPAKAGVQIVSP